MFFGVEDLKTDEIFLKLTKTCEEQPEKRWLPAYYLDICLVDGTTIRRNVCVYMGAAEKGLKFSEKKYNRRGAV